MDFELSEEQRLIQKQIRELCADFGDEYWREKDREEEYPWEFHDALARDGWFGLNVPREYGGQGYGIQEAVLVQLEVARSGGGHTGVSVTSAQAFNAEPIVAFGDDDVKEQYLRRIASGDDVLAVGVTEPNAGLDTSRVETFAEREGDEYVVNGEKIWTSRATVADLMLLLVRTTPREEAERRFDGLTLFVTEFDSEMESVDVQPIEKAGRRASDSSQVWYDDFRIPVADRIGEEGSGFEYLLSFANSERILVGASAVGMGQAAVDKAAKYAKERVVFDNPIGSYQAIQHPLSDSWSKLEVAELMLQKAAWLYDEGEDCGGEANASKLRASEAALEACERAVRAHGGMGYSESFDVARYWREAILTVAIPVSNEMVNNYIAQHVLDLPRSY